MTQDARLYVDTALSMEGFFFDKEDDVQVEILTPYDWQVVVVSSRYTVPTGLDNAAEIAVDAYHEREGHEVPWLSMGLPFYHVRARKGPDGEPLEGIVRMDEGGDWTYDHDNDNDSNQENH